MKPVLKRLDVMETWLTRLGRCGWASIVVVSAMLSAEPVRAAEADVPDAAAIAPWIQFVQGDAKTQARALKQIRSDWNEKSPTRALETLRFVRRGPGYQQLLNELAERTGYRKARDWADWLRWLWAQEPRVTTADWELKGVLHAPIDPRFLRYFEPGRKSRIRLDEILWGGVRQNGIPPLYNPAMLSATDARYLGDNDVVFGVVVEGKAFAYPKRILAWHEMFVDTLAGVPVAGVYCTLCGTVVLYETRHEGVDYRLGTSGFLYRSNKLMFDERTHSLWSTLKGEPVVGPLVGKGIQLARRPVVTSTWKAWREQYPQTTVLSLETGHRRDYSEGAAYRDYFATDELMFPVPGRDERLKNKDEVVALLLGKKRVPVALSVGYLRQHPIYHGSGGGMDYVIVTDADGMHRVYQDLESVRFESRDDSGRLLDAGGKPWKVTDLEISGPNGQRLPRFPSHRAFWFGWHAAFPNTELISK